MYLSTLAEEKITSVNDAPVKAQGAEHTEVDDDDDNDNGNGEDGTDVHEQSSGGSKAKRGKERASQGKNVKIPVACTFVYNSSANVDDFFTMLL